MPQDNDREVPRIGNVRREYMVPADFEAKAKSKGFSPNQLLWQLAEDYCANTPTAIDTEMVDDNEPIPPEE